MGISRPIAEWSIGCAGCCGMGMSCPAGFVAGPVVVGGGIGIGIVE
jgi:hypothetical protein